MPSTLRQKINEAGRKLLDSKTDKERDKWTERLNELDPNGIELLSMVRDVFSFKQETKDRGVFRWGWTNLTISTTKEFSRHELRVLYCMAEILNQNLEAFIKIFRATEKVELPKPEEPEDEDFIRDLEVMMAEPLDVSLDQAKKLRKAGVLKKKKKSRRTPNQRDKKAS
jgi:hypothetical protein